MGDALQAWAEASKAKAEVSMAKAERYRARSVEATSSSVTSADYTLNKCVTTLDEIDGISDDAYMKALEKFKDADWREMFISMSSDRKKAWLARL